MIRVRPGELRRLRNPKVVHNQGARPPLTGMARIIFPLWPCALSALVLCAACASDDSDSQNGSGGRAGAAVTSGKGGQPIGLGGGGSAGVSNVPSTGGSTDTGGSQSTGGSSAVGGSKSAGGSSTAGASGDTDGAGVTGSGASGTQPLGAICANTSNCSDSEGAVVCCQQTCTLADACPASTTYLACDSAADCAKYGGGKLCCEVQTTSDTMRFCTKQSACSGKVLP
jgi:hypothetical protein